ncbi:MAG: serine/threonine-protein kinase [Planctomycetaceae bacterium]
MNDFSASPNHERDRPRAVDVLKLVDELAGGATPGPDEDGDAGLIVAVSKGVRIFGPRLAPGTQVGRYEIRSLLGEGGMGVVYRAWDSQAGQEVALKVLSQDAGSNPSALQHFLGEARAIGRLNSPHVVTVYDIDRWNGHYYLVMELLSAGSAADRTREWGKLPWKEAFRIIGQAARGLAAAHATGTIHRDVKPENLMLSAEGIVKVVDFGLSQLMDAAEAPKATVSHAAQTLGTPQYMSPEQFETNRVDERADIYGLGATLYRLLTGRFPYHDCRTVAEMKAAHVSRSPPDPLALAPALPTACRQIIAKAMAKQPVERYRTAEEMAGELERAIAASD